MEEFDQKLRDWMNYFKDYVPKKSSDNMPTPIKLKVHNNEYFWMYRKINRQLMHTKDLNPKTT